MMHPPIVGPTFSNASEPVDYIWLILSPEIHQCALLSPTTSPSSALDLLRAEGWTIDAQSGRTPDQLKIDLADADALVVRSATKVTPDIIAAAPKLRAIARAGTGVDNVDVETAQRSRHRRDERAGRQQHQRGGARDGPDPVAGTEAARRRRVDEAGTMGQEEFRRRRGARQGAGPRRPRAHRAGGRAPRAGIRDDRHRARSVHLGPGGRGSGRRAGLARRPVRASRLPVAAHAVHAADQATRSTPSGWRAARRAFV